jgi:hypothetical protein
MTRPEGATMDEILSATGGSFQYNAKRRPSDREGHGRTASQSRAMIAAVERSCLVCVMPRHSRSKNGVALLA